MNLNFGQQVALAGIISMLIGYLKKSKYFPWITAETSKVNRLVAISLSGLATIGVHFSYSAQAHTLLISGLSLITIAVGVWHWIQQSFVTHGWYKSSSYAEEILALLKAYLAQQGSNPQAQG